MKKPEQGSLIAIITLIVTALLVGALGFIFWQNFLQPKSDNASKQQESSKETADRTPVVEMQAVTSTLDGWTVSLQAPKTWAIKTEDTKDYNYKSDKFEAAKKITLTHSSGKVSVDFEQVPSGYADGYCPPASIAYLNKETLADNRLALLEAVSENESHHYFLGITDSTRAAGITKDSDACSLHYGLGLVTKEGAGGGSADDSRVIVEITPSFADSSKGTPNWNDKTMIDFLKTEEYLEAKAIVKSLKI